MKLNKFIPIVTLTSIATIAMPIVTSCGCKGGDTPEDEIAVNLHDEGAMEPELGIYIYSNPINITKGNEYEFKFSFENIKLEERTDNDATGLRFCVGNAKNKFTDVGGIEFDEDSISVSVTTSSGEKKIPKVDVEELDKCDMGWCYGIPEEPLPPLIQVVYTEENEFNNWDNTFTIKVKPMESKENYFPVGLVGNSDY